MNKKSIIFIVIAVILVIVGFSSTNTSKQTDAISKAVYVEDGKVLPENAIFKGGISRSALVLFNEIYRIRQIKLKKLSKML